jgi:hypothetical protein
MFKKILFSIIAAFFLLVIIPAPLAKAEENWYTQNYFEWFLKVYDPSNPQEIFGERYTAAQVEWVFWSVLATPYRLISYVIGQNFPYDVIKCAYTGDCSFQNTLQTTGFNNQKNEIKPTNASVILKDLVRDRPLSGITYFKNVARNWHIIPQAKAQTGGFGFNALDPILPLWKAMRDVAYSLLVLVIIIFAFMIMFRVKINPQTVITVQSSLPKVVLTIILVTFSYAIAGFLVDLMYVVIGIISLVGPRLFLTDPLGYKIGQGDIYLFMTQGRTIFDLIAQSITQVAPNGFGIISAFGYYLVFFVISFLLVFIALFGIIPTGLGVGVTVLIAGGTSALLPIVGVVLIIGGLILIILLLIMVFKTIFMLLKAFAGILLLTIFAPLYLTAGALVPAFSFGSWVKNFVSNLAVFVVTGVMFLLSFSFMISSFSFTAYSLPGGVRQKIMEFLFGQATIEGLTQAPVGWPPLLNFPSNSNATMAIVFLGVSFVIFTMIPKVGDIIKSMLEGRPGPGGGIEGVTGAAFIGSQGAQVIGEYLSSKGPKKLIPLGKQLKTVGGTLETGLKMTKP